MRLGSISLQVDKSDTPKYYRPQSALPTGWLSIGGLASISLPDDPTAALHYLGLLDRAIYDAYQTIAGVSRTDPDNTPTQAIPAVLDNGTYL